MHRLHRSAARMRARHQTGEGGFTLVEVVVAMMVLAIALVGLAQLVGSQMVDTLHSRQRSAAIAWVNQEIEALHSMTYSRIAMDQTPGNQSAAPPSSWPPGNPQYTNPVYGSGDCGSSTCFYYEKSVTAGGFTFTEHRWVQGVGSTAPWNYKTVFVTLTATSGPSFTYSAQTDVSGATTNNPSAVNTLEVDMEQVDSGGVVVNDPSTGVAALPPDGLTVTVSLSGTTLASGTTTDGYWSTTSSSLSSGTAYTCTVTSPGGTTFQNWAAYSTLDSSFTCYDGTNYTSRWVETGCTASTSKGTLTVTVTDITGTVENGMPVHLVAAQNQTGAPPNTNTNAQGIATFNGNVPGGLWDVSITKGGFQTATGITTCIWPSTTSQLSIVLVASPKAPTSIGNITVKVANTSPGGTATMEVEAVSGSNKFEIQQDLDGCGSSCGTGTTFTVPVYTGSTYTVYVNCVGVAGVATSNAPDGAHLTSATTSSITTSGWSDPTSPESFECTSS